MTNSRIPHPARLARIAIDGQFKEIGALVKGAAFALPRKHLQFNHSFLSLNINTVWAI